MRRAIISVVVILALRAQEPPPVKFSTTTNLVVLNVTVRDRTGKTVDNLIPEDFIVLEDGKRQKVSVFEFQHLSAPLGAARPLPPARERKGTIRAASPGQVQYRNRRLIVLYFDFSAMLVEDQFRAQRGALKFLQEKMTADDQVAVMTFSSRLMVVQDFIGDRDLLTRVIRGFRIGETSALAAELGAGNPDTTANTGAAFEADDAEFQLFNTDRRLSALATAARMLAALPEKKALVYFSSGIGKTGIENLSQLRAAANAAVRANIAFYPVDSRGLVAMPPGGDASRGAPNGAGLFSGATQYGLMDSLRAQQQTLYTLAADTGGKALFDSNDLSEGITQAQNAFQSYYILGYYSTNAAEDGRFRKTQVRLPEFPVLRVDHRAGYFAAKRFDRMTSTDKERQLEDALLLGDPVTSLPIALEVNSFRLSPGRYFVPVALKIPGSQIPLARRGEEEYTVFDFIGQVRDGKGAMVAAVRDAIRVRLGDEASARRSRGHFQYDTGFTVAPGEYRFKFLVRENQTGQMGTFETPFRVPESWPEREWVSVSSVVWSAQRELITAAAGRADTNQKREAAHPLVHNGEKLVPSITRVFRRNQTLFAYAELYYPSTSSNHQKPSIASTVTVYRGNDLVLESEPVVMEQYGTQRRATVPLTISVSLAKLPPGRYVAQFNVFDRIAHTFAQRRANIVVLP
ncbi:MAG: VWA domain-containing protein [Acidobacteria bacterium]|nr:VWA domain-containing protein [Acidobacteriota bacterium]